LRKFRDVRLHVHTTSIADARAGPNAAAHTSAKPPPDPAAVGQTDAPPHAGTKPPPDPAAVGQTDAAPHASAEPPTYAAA